MVKHRGRHKRILFHFILVMSLLLNAVPVVAASGGSEFTPWLPNKHYTFDRPVDSTIDNEGNVYIADSINNRIVKVDRNGMYLNDWGGYGSGEGVFNFPSGIAMDRNGNVYVADRGNNRIQKFDSNGNYLSEWGAYGTGNGQFRAPVNLAIDYNGNIYVADRDNYRIQVLDSNGSFLTQWGSFGTGNGQFNLIYGIAVDQTGNVYTAESENHRVQKFTSDGTYITQWGSMGTGNGQFKYPFSIEADSSGHVYVTDAQNNRIQKFDSNGVYMDQWGSFGTGSGQLSFPNSVTIDPNGNIYVTEALNNRLQTFDPNGEYLAVLNSASGIVRFNDPSGIAFNSNGNVYVIERGSHRIQTFDSSGAYLAGWGSRGNANGQFDHPTSVAINSAGHIYVTDTGNHRIQKFNADGTYTGQWGGQGSGDGLFVDPKGIAVNTNGDVYVVDSGNHRIQKFDADGDYVSQWGSQGGGNGQFESPSGIAIDSNDHIYVTDSVNHRIQKFDGDGSFLGQWGSLGHDNGQLDHPQGIAIDSHDQVYIADSNNDRIQSFTVDGAYVDQWGSTGNREGQFNNPTDIAIDPSGKVYAVDTGNQRIQWKVAKVDTPTAYPVSGTSIANNSVVSLSTATAGATIYYTTDGTVPTRSSARGTEVTITGAPGESVHVRAFAVRTDMVDSPLLSATYTLAAPATTTPIGFYDKNVDSAQNRNIVFMLNSNGYMLSDIRNGAVSLIKGLDYELTGNTVTVYSHYLTTLPIGQTVLTFDFGSLASLSLTVHISDSTPVPGAPLLQPAVSGDGQASLTWVPVNGAANYHIYQSSTPSVSGTRIASVVGSVYDYTATGLANGTTYYFTIQGENQQGTGPFSNIISATPFTLPDVPTNVLAVAGDSQATITFNAPAFDGGSPITGYEVIANPGGLTTAATTSPFTFRGLTNGIAYTFTVKAINAGGSGAESAPSNAVTPMSTSTSPPTPTPAPPNVVMPTPTPSPLTPTSPEPTPEISKPDIFKSDIIDLEKLTYEIKEKLQSAASVQSFTDISNNWAITSINKLVKLDAIQGYPDRSFKPNQVITRAEFASMLARLLVIDVTHAGGAKFPDVQQHWAKDAIEALAYYGIVTGDGDGSFKPDEAITREDMVVMIVRLLNVEALPQSGSVDFIDLTSAGNYATESIEAAQRARIVTGYTDQTFKPKGLTTRAETATILIRLLALDASLKEMLEHE
ncbi:Serine/threonine-protein kinase PknD [compost metagenome]